MPYVSFSLKYRPQRFEEIVGQEHVTRTLVNAIAGGRLVHGYLFSGPRGTGKTSTARVLAKALNCVEGPTSHPCCECASCTAIQQGRAMDVIEIDAASNRGIDEIRELREKVKYSPAEARSKIYILDEVHMLTPEAFNALLKTLEEPPDHSYFVLATTEPHKVPPTIMSRCQRFDFRPIPVPEIVQALGDIVEQEGLNAQDQALEAIARAGDGAMRDAESILDQVAAYSDDVVDLETVNAVLGVTESETLAEMADLIANGDLPGAFTLVDRLVAEGKDVEQLMEDLTVYARDLLRISLGSEPPVWTLPGDEGQARMRGQAEAIGTDQLMEAIDILTEAQTELRSSSQPSLLLELTAAKLCGLAAEEQSGSAPRQKQHVQGAQQKAQQEARRQAQKYAQQQASGAKSGAATSDAASEGESGAQAEKASRQPPPRPVIEGPVTLEMIKEHWENVPDELKRMRQLPIGAIISEGTPTAYDDGKLTVHFGSEYTFHYNQARDRYHATIEEALERLFGDEISLVCRLSGESPGGEGAAAAGAGSQAEQPQLSPTGSEGEQAEAGGHEPEPTEEPAQPEGEDAPEAEQTDSASELDQAVRDTLSLFEGSREIEADE